MGSEPKVATEQEKLPLRILYTNFPDAPKATLVEPLTEHVCPTLQIVTYPSGRLEAENALAAQPSKAVVIRTFFNMISISSVIGINERIDRIKTPAKFRELQLSREIRADYLLLFNALDTAKSGGNYKVIFQPIKLIYVTNKIFVNP
ncbi:MAG TPA: hypothetical protein VLC79_12540 [Cellvibrio sp.]|nr:hypothetical protein [Cellvibrio sp.]